MRSIFRIIMIGLLIVAILLYIVNANCLAFLIGLVGLSMSGLYFLLDQTGELNKIDKAEAEIKNEGTNHGKRKF